MTTHNGFRIIEREDAVLIEDLNNSSSVGLRIARRGHFPPTDLRGGSADYEVCPTIFSEEQGARFLQGTHIYVGRSGVVVKP